MKYKDTIESFIKSAKDTTYEQATASGGLVGFLYEFILGRGEEIFAVFVFGLVGALGGAVAKWLINLFNIKNNKNE